MRWISWRLLNLPPPGDDSRDDGSCPLLSYPTIPHDNEHCRVRDPVDDVAGIIRLTLSDGGGDCRGRRRVLLRSHWDLGKGLHSSTIRLNVSIFRQIRWVHDFPAVYQTGGHGEV
jgi:hypothetical protein